LTVIFKNEGLKAVVTGFHSEAFWLEVLNRLNEDSTYFLTPTTAAIIEDDVKEKIEEIILPRQEMNMKSNVYEVLPITLSLALTDSVNPCTFAVFTVILLVSLHTFGRKKAALTGLCFITAVYISYYLLGLGLLHVLAVIPDIKRIVALLGLLIAADSVRRGLKRNFKSPIAGFIKRRIVSLINNPLTPSMAFAAGFIISITILPCSGGPYLIGLGFLSSLREPIYTYLLLALYNIIFVMPMSLILIAFSAFSSNVRKIKALRRTRYNTLELVSGILLTVICIYALIIS